MFTAGDDYVAKASSDHCPPGSPLGTNHRESSVHKPDLDFLPNPRLVEEGWERRFMADPECARESTEMYQSLGFEVLSEPVLPAELSEVCTDCQVAVCRLYVTLYTRKKR